MGLWRLFLVVPFVLLPTSPMEGQAPGKETDKLKARAKQLEAENAKLRQEIAKLRADLPARILRSSGKDVDELAKQVDFSKESLVVLRTPDLTDVSLSFTVAERRESAVRIIARDCGLATNGYRMHFLAIANTLLWRDVDRDIPVIFPKSNCIDWLIITTPEEAAASDLKSWAEKPRPSYPGSPPSTRPRTGRP